MDANVFPANVFPANDQAPLALIDHYSWTVLESSRAFFSQGQEETEGEREDALRVEREEQYATQVIGGMLKEDFQEEDRTCPNGFDTEVEGFVILVAQDHQTTKPIPLGLALQECAYIAMVIKSKGNWTNVIEENGNLILALGDYPLDAVEGFADLLRTNDGGKSIDPSISGETLLEMCRISHFLCAERILNAIHDELLACVDSASCLAIGQLAEELRLPRLLEASLARMIDSLDIETIKDDLTVDLCERINQIKCVINSSLNTGSRLFFGSMEEYIAIFAERVSYLEERLLEAQEQFAMAEAGMSDFGRKDARQKITRQEKRVKTLRTALQEQRKLFLSKPGGINRKSIGK